MWVLATILVQFRLRMILFSFSKSHSPLLVMWVHASVTKGGQRCIELALDGFHKGSCSLASQEPSLGAGAVV